MWAETEDRTELDENNIVDDSLHRNRARVGEHEAPHEMYILVQVSIYVQASTK